MPTMTQLSYDPSGAFLDGTGITRAELAGLAPRLTAARDETLADVELWRSGGSVPAEKQPLDAGFIPLPERILAEYRADRRQSELARLLATSRRLADAADRVVVLGIGGSYMGARALFEACCHPYHNELSRGDRASRPRMYFEGNNLDNDALHGLLELLGEKKSAGVDDRWGIVVISKSGGTLETAVAFRRFLDALQKSCGEDRELLANLVVPVTGASGKLRNLAAAIRCPDVFDIPDGVGGRFSILSAVGLLPAALLGLDVVRLLEGAAAATERFRTAPVGSNPVLDFVGVCHLMEQRRGATIRVLSTWGKGLEAAGLWYDQLLAESLGKRELGATPLTVVNTRDLHSRGQQHQEGRRDKLITNLRAGSPRRAALAVGTSEHDQDELNALAKKTLPELMAAAFAGTNEAYREDARPTADMTLPRLDEFSLGDFFQTMMLATVVEGRLIGVNPYGQPGVEGYKRHMTRLLQS